MSVALVEKQRIATSGARAVEAFTVDGWDLLAIPQLAVDVPGSDAALNGGDSDTDLVLLRRTSDGYVPWSTLSVPGGEDAEFLTIGGRALLAVASIRSGAGPYDYAPGSAIFAWDGSTFVVRQTVPSFAAKQWKHWQIGGRHFLGLAQGLQRPGANDPPVDSVVYEWDGETFVEQQRIPSRWAYNWHQLVVDGDVYVAHADHVQASVLYRWDGSQLVAHQTLAAEGGRAFASFQDGGSTYLVVACLTSASRVLRWNGRRFEHWQELDGRGARELAVVRHDGRLLVVRVNFILGTPADPRPVMDSVIYEWDGERLVVAARFPTCGGTDVAVVTGRDGPELIVSNSLTPELRFAADTVRYALRLDGVDEQ